MESIAESDNYSSGKIDVEDLTHLAVLEEDGDKMRDYDEPPDRGQNKETIRISSAKQVARTLDWPGTHVVSEPWDAVKTLFQIGDVEGILKICRSMGVKLKPQALIKCGDRLKEKFFQGFASDPNESMREKTTVIYQIALAYREAGANEKLRNLAMELVKRGMPELIFMVLPPERGPNDIFANEEPMPDMD